MAGNPRARAALSRKVLGSAQVMRQLGGMDRAARTFEEVAVLITHGEYARAKERTEQGLNMLGERGWLDGLVGWINALAMIELMDGEAGEDAAIWEKWLARDEAGEAGPMAAQIEMTVPGGPGWTTPDGERRAEVIFDE